MIMYINISVGNAGLYLAQNCRDQPGVRITGVRITDAPLVSLNECLSTRSSSLLY